MGDGSELTGVISGVELQFAGASVGTAITNINFSGFSSVCTNCWIINHTVAVGKSMTTVIRRLITNNQSILWHWKEET